MEVCFVLWYFMEALMKEFISFVLRDWDFPSLHSETFYGGLEKLLLKGDLCFRVCSVLGPLCRFFHQCNHDNRDPRPEELTAKLGTLGFFLLSTSVSRRLEGATQYVYVDKCQRLLGRLHKKENVWQFTLGGLYSSILTPDLSSFTAPLNTYSTEFERALTTHHETWLERSTLEVNEIFKLMWDYPEIKIVPPGFGGSFWNQNANKYLSMKLAHVKVDIKKEADLDILLARNITILNPLLPGL